MRETMLACELHFYGAMRWLKPFETVACVVHGKRAKSADASVTMVDGVPTTARTVAVLRVLHTPEDGTAPSLESVDLGQCLSAYACVIDQARIFKLVTAAATRYLDTGNAAHWSDILHVSQTLAWLCDVDLKNAVVRPAERWMFDRFVGMSDRDTATLCSLLLECVRLPSGRRNAVCGPLLELSDAAVRAIGGKVARSADAPT